MKPIQFIDNLSFSVDGYFTAIGSSGRSSSIFMRQGDLDAACAVYSLMMMLIFNRRVTRRALITRENKPGYTSIMRLQDEFIGSLPGLYKDGYFFNDLSDKLRTSFKKVATATTFSTISDREDYVSKQELNNKILETLKSGFPVQIGYTYKGGESGHSVVAIGFQDYHEAGFLRLFCLDPGHELNSLAFWNNIIDVNLNINSRIKYQDCSHADIKYLNTIKVDEILIIDQKE